jgi:hypothetical protein
VNARDWETSPGDGHYCDSCGVQPATKHRHSGGFRLCSACEKTHIVFNGNVCSKEVLR